MLLLSQAYILTEGAVKKNLTYRHGVTELFDVVSDAAQSTDVERQQQQQQQ